MDAPRLSGATVPTLVPMLTILVLAWTSGCSTPAFEGPQLQDPPEGFVYDANSTHGRTVFPDREQLWEGAWWRMDSLNDTHTTFFITAYSGGTTRDQVQAARDAQAERYGHDWNEYSGLESVRIDGRDAWAWAETQRDRQGRIAGIDYKAVVSYDTVTYALEGYSDQEEWMDPTRLKATVTSFGVGRTEILWTPLIIALLLALVGAGWLKEKTKTAARPVTLREITVPDPDGPEPPEGSQPARGPPGDLES